LAYAGYDGDDVKRILLRTLVAFIVIPLVALCSFLVWMAFAFNWNPPAMFSQQFPVGEHWDRRETDAAITEVLNRNFPSGSLVSDMRLSLSKAGFRDVSPPPSNCVQRTAEAPIGMAFTLCYDHRNQMEYSWSMGLVCGGHIYIKWMMDENGKIIRIEGSEAGACI
jgi:hypothetical protein